MVQPITPDQVNERRVVALPDEILEVFNELIVEKWDGCRATIKQDDLVERIVSRLDVERHQVFKKGWLNVEGIYRDAGWRVLYDKPGYNESYPATFEFRHRSKS